MRERRGRHMTVIAAASLILLMFLAAWAAFTPAEEIAFPAEPEYMAAEYVYVTPSGSKFHRAGCSAVNKSQKLECISRDAAVEKGYEACMICEP